MKGKIGFHDGRGIYYVAWYHAPHRKTYKVYYYNGERLESKKLAVKLLSKMQARYEQECDFPGIFRIEEFTGDQCDTISYLEEWLKTITQKRPGTYRAYKSDIHNHIIPFFKMHPTLLKEIQYDVIKKLLSSLDLGGTAKRRVIYTLRGCLDYAHRSHRIMYIPPFPKESDYGIIKKRIAWLPSERQERVLNAIPEIHQPIFWWTKLHLRRPNEACALRREDFDGKVFTLRHGISGGQPIDGIKTGYDEIMMVDAFIPWLERMRQRTPILSPYFFTNPQGRSRDKRYTWDFMKNLWHKACKETGEHISLYPGLRHSSASQLINEQGLSVDQAQMVLGHKDRKTTLKYAEVEMATRKALMEGKVIQIGEKHERNKI